MKNNQANNQLSALVLKGYELVFFRKHLGMERVVPELGKVKADYINNVLKPELEKIDTQVSEMREAYAERTPAGKLKTNEAGEIQYGDKTAEIRAKFGDIIGVDVILPIHDKAQFLTVRDIFNGLKQELDEDDTNVYLQVTAKLNSVDIKSLEFAKI